MLIDVIRVFREYVRLDVLPLSEEQRLAKQCLRENVNFRLTLTESADPFIGFRVFWRTMRDSLRRPSAAFQTGTGTGRVILNGTFKNRETITEYIARHDGGNPDFFLSKEQLPTELGQKPMAAVVLIFIGLPMATRCLLWSKRRGHAAMFIRQLAETAGLLSFLHRHQIKEVYDYAPYLVDSNFNYLLLKQRGVFVTKLPSPGPLMTHNMDLFCDRLITSSAYHLDELRHLNHNIRFQVSEHWLPEGAFGYIHRYLDSSFPPRAGVVGFYSHASWVRLQEAHVDNGLNVPKTEHELLRMLGKYLRERPNREVVVFLHPHERKPELMEKTRAFYTQYLGTRGWSFSEPGIPSTHSFELCDTGVAAFSTIIYERLFCGYKTLIGNFHTPGFPLPESRLNGIVFRNEAEGIEMLETTLGQSPGEFFNRNNIEDYRWDAYEYFHHRPGSG